MPTPPRDLSYLNLPADGGAGGWLPETPLETDALQRAIFNSANFSSIATDATGVIQIFNVGAERMLGFSAADVLNQITPADISDPLELVARAEALTVELGTPITPGFEALVFKASRGIEDIYELTYIRKDGSRLPALVSVTALRDSEGAIIGYLLIGTDNTARKQVEAERQQLLEAQEETNRQLQRANVTLRESEEKLAVTLYSIGDAVIATDRDARVTVLNPLAEQLTGWTQAEAFGRPVQDVFRIISQETRAPAPIPVADTLALGTFHGLTNHTIVIARDGAERSIADSCAPIRDREGRVIGAVLVFRDVTDEYQARQALSNSTAQMRTILNTVVDAIITFHAQGGIVETVNPAAERMFGYAAADLIGRPFSMLIPEMIEHGGEGSLDYYGPSAEARAVGIGREVMGRHAEGRVIPMELTVSEMYLGNERYFTGVLRDITTRKHVEDEQKKLDQRLRDQQFYTRSLIESNIDALVTTDPAGIITDLNKQMEALTGWTRDELIGAPFKDCFTDPTRAANGIKRVLNEKKVTDYELIAHDRNGNETEVSCSATTFYDRARTLQGVFAAVRVITEQKRLDRELLGKNVELESARVVAELANHAKSDFLSSMSHELRSPLNAILGFAQLLESDTPPPTPGQRASIEQILSAGWYLLQLINEVLDLAVVESGKLSLSVEPVPLGEVLNECQAMIEPQARQRNIQVSFTPLVGPQLFVAADRIRLKQTILNLLSNAIKYNRVGGTVVVDCVSLHERARIRVRDTGLGLSAAKLSLLFHPFNRLGQEYTGEEGTGIGLVMSKLLVELMGGSIGVESVVGVGSVFWFELCVVIPPALVEHKALPPSEPRRSPGSQVRTLLYVEDNPANLRLVEHLIARRPDMHMLSAATASLGIAAARHHLPDIILMDINLPGMNGIQAMNILREDATTAHIPVLAISANAMLGDIRKGVEAGFMTYLTKPINVVEFMAAIDHALDTVVDRTPSPTTSGKPT